MSSEPAMLPRSHTPGTVSNHLSWTLSPDFAHQGRTEPLLNPWGAVESIQENSRNQAHMNKGCFLCVSGIPSLCPSPYCQHHCLVLTVLLPNPDMLMHNQHLFCISNTIACLLGWRYLNYGTNHTLYQNWTMLDDNIWVWRLARLRTHTSGSIPFYHLTF